MSLLTAPIPVLPDVQTDEAAARRALRAQIARLEEEAAAVAPLTKLSDTRLAPRLMSLAELEASRDELVERLRAGSVARDATGLRQEGFRRLREEILIDPQAHPYVRVTNADIGEPGCHDWHVRPRFGLLGRLANWWRVVISSGCP